MLQLVETQPLKYPTYRQEGSRLYKQDVQKRLETAHAKAKRRYDLRKRPQQFEEGTSVWKKKLCPVGCVEEFHSEIRSKVRRAVYDKEKDLTIDLRTS
ncbi:hypothetical protein PPYR_07666 [Photinus pyralis]|uniref:Uncharacterized protein n=1 Tax=Photinus pyralis TaxID=7054 RepID=A0A5N4AR61_PHOPY|nr:hypothetical protein PPYR_07666 [Photinus pyralis]